MGSPFVDFLNQADIPLELVRINSIDINGTELVKINYDTIIEEKFEEYPILNYLRGTVFVTMKHSYNVLYRAMNRFNYPANISTFDHCIEKLDGVMILPYIFNGQVYFSSRWRFDTDPVKYATELAGYDYKEFIIKCFKANIYLTFELVIPQSFIKTIYPEERYGLYLVASQDKYGNPYPLIKKDNKVWVSNGNIWLEVPALIKTPIIYDFRTIEELEKFFEPFEGRDFEGVVVYKDSIPYKIKTPQYQAIRNSKTQLYKDMALSVIKGDYEKFPDQKTIKRLRLLYDDILTLYQSFKYMSKYYRSKKAIARDIDLLPPYFKVMYYFFEKREDKVWELLHKYYLDRVVRIMNLDADIEKEDYQSYV